MSPSAIHSPRRRLAPWWAAATAAALAGAAACRRDAAAEVRVLVDSVTAAGASAVLALPIDPGALPAPRVESASSGPRADSIARWVSLRDSADALDAAFQRQRAELNREAAAMRAADPAARRSPEYTTRFADFERRAAAAEAQRATRDRVRARLTVLRNAFGDPPPPELARADRPASRPRDAVDSASRSAGRASVSATLDGTGGATLRLAAGRWWLAVAARDGAVLLPAAERELAAGARDTVRLERRAPVDRAPTGRTPTGRTPGGY